MYYHVMYNIRYNNQDLDHEIGTLNFMTGNGYNPNLTQPDFQHTFIVIYYLCCY